MLVGWGGDLGVRVPVGGQLHFAKNLDANAQVISRRRFKKSKNDNADLAVDFGIGVLRQF